MGLINKLNMVIIVILVCSCNNKNTHNIPTDLSRLDTNEHVSEIDINKQITEIPELLIHYGPGLEVDGSNIKIETAKAGTASWSYYNGENIMSWEQCGLHTLDSSDYIPIIEGQNKIKISFTYEPDSYTVRYWPMKYLGDAYTFEMNFETMDVIDNIIIIPDEELGYVFEFSAVWEAINGISELQGNAYYGFIIKQ